MTKIEKRKKLFLCFFLKIEESQNLSPRGLSLSIKRAEVEHGTQIKNSKLNLNVLTRPRIKRSDPFFGVKKRFKRHTPTLTFLSKNKKIP